MQALENDMPAPNTHHSTTIRPDRAVSHRPHRCASADAATVHGKPTFYHSSICPSHLETVAHGELQRRWKVDHADFIAMYNATVNKEGLPLEQWRGF